MSRKLIEYALVILVAIIVSLLLIWLFFGPTQNKACTGCTVTALPQQRQECEKQFSGGYGSTIRTLPPGVHDEYQIAFDDPNTTTDSGYNSSGYSSSPTGVAPIAGFVIMRARLGSIYDPSTSTYSNSNFTPPPQGQEWDKVKMAVSTYATPLRNDSICGEKPVRFFDDKFEAYCDLPTQFQPDDPARKSFRVFVLNNSDSTIEYCIVSNCSASHGKVCQIELNAP